MGVFDRKQLSDSDVVLCLSPGLPGPPVRPGCCPVVLAISCHTSPIPQVIVSPAPAESPHLTQHGFSTLLLSEVGSLRACSQGRRSRLRAWVWCGWSWCLPTPLPPRSPQCRVSGGPQGSPLQVMSRPPSSRLKICRNEVGFLHLFPADFCRNFL